jgi:hypothetical protein
MSALGDNRLPVLATSIAVAHKAQRASAIEAATMAIEAGRLLIEAKELVAHGEWAPWLLANVGFSERTARRYMQIARSGIKTDRLAVLGILATAEAVAKGAGDLPKPEEGTEIEVFEGKPKSYDRPFLCDTRRTTGILRVSGHRALGNIRHSPSSRMARSSGHARLFE